MRRKCAEEGRCRVCAVPQTVKALETAHIIARARTQPGSTAGDHPLNAVPLCHACHRSYDRQGHGPQLDLLPHLDRGEQAKAVELAGGILNALHRITGEDWHPASSEKHAA